MRLETGQTVDGRYRLLERIGSGGMADVWAAEDTQLGRRVALKVLHDNFARDREFIERFRREAEHAAGLQHPNVVGVFDRGDVDDTYYIAMELIEGSSLRDLTKRGLTVAEAVEATRQILSAAGYAHERGIVHRDLKPLNVLVDQSGRIRVTDFGIARAGTSEITQTGSVMGTAQYISPEQAQGQEVTRSSDIYAVGIVLYEMLTGNVPFDGDNPVAIAMKQVSGVPRPPSEVNPAVSPALDGVVLRALAKDPANRFATAEEMSAALDAAEANPAQVDHTQRFDTLGYPVLMPDDDRKRWIALVALALIAAGLAAYLLIGDDDGALVPGVVKESERVATEILQDAGFDVDVDTVVAEQAPDTVIEQDPLGGTEAAEGSTVTIVVSAVGQAEVPDLLGETRARAESLLEREGFEAEFSESPSDTVSRGRVISTDPDPGTSVTSGETVRVVVSSGSETTPVSDVVGLNRVDAQAELEAEGFIVDTEPVNSDAPEDEVVRQSPPAGDELAEGEAVTIFYSTGAGTIVLDDFVGQTGKFAARELGAQGLEVVIREAAVEDKAQNKIVLSQAPSPGARLSPGNRVTITVGVFEEPIIPDPEPEPSPEPDPDPEPPAPTPRGRG